MAELLPMHKEKLFLKFDGPALAGHTMDVAILGPALTGLGDLISSANKVVNGSDVKIRVAISADVKAGSVKLEFEVLQSLVSAFQQFLGIDFIEHAKGILEHLGLFRDALGGITVWQLIKWLVDKRKPGQKVEVKVDGEAVVVKVGDETIVVSKTVYQMASDASVQKGFRELLSPLNEDGITAIAVVPSAKNSQPTVISQDEAKPVLEANEVDLDPTISPQVIEGHITIHALTFSKNAKFWKFRWHGRVEDVDIKSTNIAEQVIERGGINIGDAYRVKMEVTERKNSKGDYKFYFRVIEVLEFLPAGNSLTPSLPGIEED